ncbi:uncharacterized protein SAPINGB_P000024 [Magnusiomyces paraingens]|uniref:Polynucleotide 5'-hydroxyl-kinase GRC3 n=1 Tax=Magnusiomyces paraingens TaxID=2606893 RepID=A0A5E8B1N3_9ASCO|nr:uncharacterized protein SAPINGB_P000024 [Saprochaete ingens]VVT43522.1 unnamed protein product [Saprochaete ingens]
MKRKSAFQALNKVKKRSESLDLSQTDKSDDEIASQQNANRDSSIENESIEDSESQHTYESLELSDSDSSNNEDESIPLKSTIQISNFTPTKSNINYTGSSIVAGLRLGESLVFQGQYMLTVQMGCVSIYGATLHVGSKRYKVSASAATALPRITALSPKKKYLGKVIETPENSFLTQPPEEISTIILIESLHTGLEQIPYILPKFQNLWGPQLSSNPSEMFRSFHPIYNGPPSTKTVESYESWRATANEIISDFKSSSYPTVVFVTGPKNSGKSTFCRYLLNYTLSNVGKNSVHFLDCDPGQSEYSPPGTVYLSTPQNFNFSSPFAHPNFEDVIESFSLGYNSPKDVPLLYSACFQALFSIYKSSQSDNASSILIVNTPGWTKGLGLELLVDMMKISQFTHAIFLGADDIETLHDFNNRVLSIIDGDDQYQKIYTPESFLQVSSTKSSVHHSTRQYTASDMRTLQSLCYFFYNFQTHSFDFEKSFSQLPFFSVPILSPPHFAEIIEKNVNVTSSGNNEEIEEIEEIEISDKPIYAPKELLSLYQSNADSKFIASLIPNSKIQHKEVRQSAKISAFGIMAAEGLNPTDVSLCLEGTVLSILVVKEYVFSQLSHSLIPAPVVSKNGKTTYLPWIPPNHIATFLSPSITRCLGLAVIRSINPASNSVVLQSPIDPKHIDDLEHTNEKIVLLRGRLDMPAYAQLDLSSHSN